jgi:hypothetical protein
MAVSRRNFLRRGWEAGTALLAAAAAWTTWELLRPLTSNAAGGKLPVGSPADYPPGTATYVREVASGWPTPRVICSLCRRNAAPRMSSALLRQLRAVRVPVHGSVFDIGGEWIEGPLAARQWVAMR